jgi:hypothetical protein
MSFCNQPYYSCYAYPCVTNRDNLCHQLCNQCQPNISCQTICHPHPHPIEPPFCPPVTYITTAPTVTSIPTSAVGVALPQIPIGSITVPINTVTVINGYGTPTTNIGGITLNITNGHFTIPIAGKYIISAYIGFTALPVGVREVDIYKVDASTGIISLIVANSTNAVFTGNTLVTLTTIAELRANDRLFVSVTQNSGSIISTTFDTRVAITRVC